MSLLYKNEIWREIDFGSDNIHPKYEISNYGRIKSYAVDPEKGVIIKGSIVQGYNTINIRLPDKKLINRYVHKLVAQAFLNGKTTDQQYVIHLDYNKANNYVHNLKWVSKQELYEHNNNNPAVRKKRTTGYKLTETKVKVIKRLLKANKTRLSLIAKRFNITHTQLNRIRSGENWGHVTLDN
ncbi:hypothetical protein BH23BAC1_BH23BAC1_12010 [soil metagenome]